MFNNLYILTNCASELVRNKKNVLKVCFFNKKKNPCVSEGEKFELTSQAAIQLTIAAKLELLMQQNCTTKISNKNAKIRLVTNLSL